MTTGGIFVGASKALGPALMWLGGMIVLVVIAGLVILKIRGSMFARYPGGADQEGLLAGLRRMRDAGEITPEEYDTARKSLVARATGGATPPRPIRGAAEKRSRPGYDLTGAPLPDQPPRDAE
jgi:hypothetical protein